MVYNRKYQLPRKPLNLIEIGRLFCGLKTQLEEKASDEVPVLDSILVVDETQFETESKKCGSSTADLELWLCQAPDEYIGLDGE